jgi:CRP-like cAMP-binding protein
MSVASPVSPRRRQHATSSTASRGNHSPSRLLRALSAPDYAALVPSLRRVTLSAGQIVSEPLQPPRHVYFPETAVLSLIVVMSDGAAVEAATVGNEGVAGLSAFLGEGAMSTKCLCQIAGDAQRITAPALVRAVAASPRIAVALRRYTQAFVNQLAQSVACNRLHSIDQRCARWLLMTHDRVGGGDSFDLTQQFLSYMLGVRREGVSAASHYLQELGIIRYRRGHLSVLDRPALERAACECYGATRTDYARLFG